MHVGKTASTRSQLLYSSNHSYSSRNDISPVRIHHFTVHIHICRRSFVKAVPFRPFPFGVHNSNGFCRVCWSTVATSKQSKPQIWIWNAFSCSIPYSRIARYSIRIVSAMLKTEFRFCVELRCCGRTAAHENAMALGVRNETFADFLDSMQSCRIK